MIDKNVTARIFDFIVRHLDKVSAYFISFIVGVKIAFGVAGRYLWAFKGIFDESCYCSRNKVHKRRLFYKILLSFGVPFTLNFFRVSHFQHENFDSMTFDVKSNKFSIGHPAPPFVSTIIIVSLPKGIK